MPPTGPSGIAVVVGGNVVVAGARVVDAHTILDFPFGVVVRTAPVVTAIAATVVDVAASACLFRRGNRRWCCHRAGSWRLLLTTLALALLVVASGYRRQCGRNTCERKYSTTMPTLASNPFSVQKCFIFRRGANGHFQDRWRPWARTVGDHGPGPLGTMLLE